MASWNIIPLHIGTLAPYDKSVFTYGRNGGVTIEAPCIVWMVTDGHTTVAVDAGPSLPDRANRHHGPYTCPPEQTLASALARIGVDPAKVDAVILSHLHWDHVGGVDVFPQARFFVQREELRAAVAPVMTQRIAYEVGLSGLLPAWMSVFDRMEVLDGDHLLAPGLEILTLPGHTPGIQGLLVETAHGPALIASDAIPLVDNWEGDRTLRHIPNGIHADLYAYEATFRKMEARARWVLPGHDSRAFDPERYPFLKGTAAS